MDVYQLFHLPFLFFLVEELLFIYTAITRSFFMSTGALLFLLVVISPTFIINGSFGDGLWKYGSLLGLFGVLFPVLFFLIGTPKIEQDLQRLLVRMSYLRR